MPFCLLSVGTNGRQARGRVKVKEVLALRVVPGQDLLQDGLTFISECIKTLEIMGNSGGGRFPQRKILGFLHIYL